MEAHKVAILAGLAITDELFQGRRGDRDQAARITALVEEFARLAPARRSGAGSADAG
jgi:hypothetical protein